MGILSRIAIGLGAATAASIGGLVLFSGGNALRAQRLAPRDGRFVEVEGARLHYVEFGSGPAIVLIHGLSGQLRNFTYALTELLARDYRVIAVDRPGSGYSTSRAGGDRTLPGQAETIARFIEALGLEKPLLVGHSLGGALSLAVALTHPELIGGLALLAPLTQPIETLSRAFTPLLIPSPLKRRLVAWTLAAPLGRLKRHEVRRLIFGPDPAPDDFEDRGGGALSLRPSAFFSASSEVSLGTGALQEMVTRYPTLAMPVGILYGRGDRILSPALHGGTTAAMIPGAELKIIEGGHMIPLTAPEVTADFIRAQAGRVGGRASPIAAR